MSFFSKLDMDRPTEEESQEVEEMEFTFVDVGEDGDERGLGLDAVLVEVEREKFPAKLHARNVAKRLGVKEGLIYLPGLPSINYEDSDQGVFFFRQRRYFYYLSGINYPDCIVTYDIKRDRLTIWIPPARTGRTVIYMGSGPTAEDVQAISEFDSVATITDIKGYLTDFAHHKSGKIYLLHEYRSPKVSAQIVYKDGTSSSLKASPFDYKILQPAMDASRVIKTPYEIKMIRKACAISKKAHINVLLGLREFKNEAEIEAVFAATCIANKAKNQSYGIIAGSGTNASTLHYGANNEPLKGRQLVVLDAGCEYKCYASDITRTFPISGKWTTEGKAIYDIVAQMQEECIDMVKPGANYRIIHSHANAVAVRGLVKLGILGNAGFEELYDSGIVGAFFPHGLGHYMGLEVHDVGDGGNLLFGLENRKDISQKTWGKVDPILKSETANPSVLEVGMVITVEPGIYFSSYALKSIYLQDPRVAKYINAATLEKYFAVGGVRIEDDILVTEDGNEVLTTVPKGEEALRVINWRDVEKEEKKGWFC